MEKTDKELEKFIEEKAVGFESWDSFFSGLSIQQETEEDTSHLYELHIIEYIKDVLSEMEARHHAKLAEVVEKIKTLKFNTPLLLGTSLHMEELINAVNTTIDEILALLSAPVTKE
jgi:hypothetical protein